MDQIDLVFLDISRAFPLASVSAELRKNNRFFLWLFLHFNKLDLNSLTFQMRSIMNSSVIITRTLQKTL